MYKKIEKIIVIGFILTLAITGIIFGIKESNLFNKENILHNDQSFTAKNINTFKIPEEKRILFVGDLMLSRGVEYQMKKKVNDFYPFEKISQFLKNFDIVAGNLEGPIIKNPPKFISTSLSFAFASNTAKNLYLANFNLLFLANNHLSDAGEKGFLETKDFLKMANIDFIGGPVKCDEESFLKKDDIVFSAFNKTFAFNCSNEEIAKMVKKIKTENPDKFLIVIFHWGEEYQTHSSIYQQNLAHETIEAGADLIIGSHPHVVQEIEEYKNKLIFYSLGNFIFDQYFSIETQESLGVGLEIYPEKIAYKLFPIQSYLSQPFLMDSTTTEKFLDNLSQKSDKDLFEQIKEGIISFPR